jgi:hypothetical protein
MLWYGSSAEQRENWNIIHHHFRAKIKALFFTPFAAEYIGTKFWEQC